MFGVCDEANLRRHSILPSSGYDEVNLLRHSIYPAEDNLCRHSIYPTVVMMRLIGIAFTKQRL